MPVGSEVRQLVEVVQQQVPTDLFPIEDPLGPSHHHVATDKVGRNLVALLKCNLGDVGQRKMAEEVCVYGGHGVLVASPPNGCNGWKAVISSLAL